MNAQLKPAIPQEIRLLLVSPDKEAFLTRLQNALDTYPDPALDYIATTVAMYQAWKDIDHTLTASTAEANFQQAYRAYLEHPHREACEHLAYVHGTLARARDLFAIREDAADIHRRYLNPV